jgi:hypothetical protein
MANDGHWTPALRLAGTLLVIALMMIGFGALLHACFKSEPPGPMPAPTPTPGATAPPVVAPTWTMAPMATGTRTPSPTVSTGARTATALSFATPVPFPTEAPVVDTPEPAATIGTLPKTGER